MRFARISASVFLLFIFAGELGRHDAVLHQKSTKSSDSSSTSSSSLSPRTLSTVSPEELLKEFSKLSRPEKENELNVLVGSCNNMLQRLFEKAYIDYTANCSANYTIKIQFLERTYMTREYIETHEEIEMVRDLLIEEKFHRVYLSPNTSFQNLFVKYKAMDAEQQKLERTAFENATKPMYYESRQFMWELFVKWLLETSFWTNDLQTSVRLTELRDVFAQAVNVQGLKERDFIRGVLVDWEDATQNTTKWPSVDGKRPYKNFLLTRNIFEQIMRLKVGKIHDDDQAYGRMNDEVAALASSCVELLQEVFQTQAKLEIGKVERCSPSNVDNEQRYREDAVPDVVREWNDGGKGDKRRGKKGKEERRSS